MAFATKYTLNWADVEGDGWQIYFQEDGYGGSTTALTPGVNPAKLSWNGGEKYQPIVGSSLDIQMVYDSNIDDLHTEESKDIKVQLYRDTGGGMSLKWEGFLVPGQYFRQFNDSKHYVTITANDGLGELKNIPYEETGGDPYYGLATEITIIAAILAKTGISEDIYEFINIYDTNHSTAASDSPLAQTYIYREKYWDEQTDERVDCYTVLEEILEKYGATIRRGVTWLIYRPNMFTLDSADYRQFTPVGVYSSNGSSNTYDILDSDTFYIHNDQELRKLMGVGAAEITLNPPRRENIFKNGSFDSFTWTAGVPDYWDDVYSSGTSIDISSQSNKIRLGSNGNAATPTEYIEATMRVLDFVSATITFDWTPTYTGAPSYKNLVFQIYNGTNYLVTAGTWQAGVGYYNLTAPTLSSGSNLKGTIEIPEDSYTRNWTLRIRIYEFHNENSASSNYVDLDNLRLEYTNNLAETRVYSHSNSLTINTTRRKELALGDSWATELFASETADDMYWVNTYNTSGGLTSDWSITGDSTAAAPIAELLARQYVEGYRRSIDELSGTFRSDLWSWGTFAIRDSNLTDEYGFAKSFFPTNVTYDTKLRECNGTWVECPATYTDEGLEWDSSTYTDYTITANEIEVNNSNVDDTATFDAYTAVAGETVRLVIELTDDGGAGSYIPEAVMDSVAITLSWGTNYITQTFATAGAKTLVIGGNTPGAGSTANFTMTVNFYSLTGV